MATPTMQPRGVVFVIAQLAALAGALWLFRRRCSATPRALAAVAIGTVLGALGLVVVVRLPRVVVEDVALFEGSIAMAQGALAGATVGAAWSARGRLCEALDALAPSLGVLVVLGRLGCFAAGCCYGRPSRMGMTFPEGTPVHADHVRRGLVEATALQSLAVHPAQFYEALVGVAMIGVGIYLARRGGRGVAFAAVAVIYAVGRFAVEMVRADPRPMAGALSIAQWLAILTLCVVVYASTEMLSRRRARS